MENMFEGGSLRLELWVELMENEEFRSFILCVYERVGYALSQIGKQGVAPTRKCD